MKDVKVLGPGCKRCQTVEAMVKAAAESLEALPEDELAAAEQEAEDLEMSAAREVWSLGRCVLWFVWALWTVRFGEFSEGFLGVGFRVWGDFIDPT